MDYLCNVCGKRDGEPQGWLLVIEMSKPGTNIRNTFFLVDQWDTKRSGGSQRDVFVLVGVRGDVSRHAASGACRVVSELRTGEASVRS